MSVSVLNTTAGLSGKTIDLTDSDQTITGLKTFSRGVNAPFAVVAGSAKVTDLDADKLDGQDSTYYTNASNIASGTLASARGGVGIDASSPTNGQLLIGKTSDGSWNKATLTAGTGISVTNGAGSITVTNSGSSVLDRDVTSTDVTNTAAETTVYSFSVPGGSLSTNRMLKLTVIGDVLNNAGALRTFTIRLKYGGTTFLSSGGMSINASASRNSFCQEYWIVAQNATNAQTCMGRFHFNSNPVATAAGSIDSQGRTDVGTNTGLTIDSTANQTLALTYQISSAETTSSIRCHTVILELI